MFLAYFARLPTTSNYRLVHETKPAKTTDRQQWGEFHPTVKHTYNIPS